MSDAPSSKKSTLDRLRYIARSFLEKIRVYKAEEKILEDEVQQIKEDHQREVIKKIIK